VEDLVQWLSAQFEEDERIARRAGDSFRQIGETGVIIATEGDRAEECASANWAGVAEHIVAQDPARVLREIDAKRRILAEVYPEVAKAEEMIQDEWHSGGDTDGDLLRLLALPYADRPGYREEWRP
jgi:hypothetical protein